MPPSEADALKRAGSIGLLLVSALIWSTTGTAAALFPPGVSGFTIGASTLGVGGLIMLLAFARRTIPALRDPVIRRYLIGGGLAVFVYALAYYTSMRMAGVAIGSLVNLGSAPIFAMLFERMIDGRKVPAHRWLGVAVTAIGLVLVAVNSRKPGGEGIVSAGGEPSLSGTGAVEILTGVALAVLAGLLYATYTSTSQRALRHRRDASGVMGATFGIGAVLLTPVLVLTGRDLLQTPQTIALATYLAVGPVVLAFWIFGVALKHVTASTATTVTLIEPVLASLLAVLVVQERILAWGWVGIAAVVAGLLLATRRGRAG